MKNFICKSIYNILYKMDDVNKFSYETAPYCGHHHEGHTGKRTRSHYNEGMGACHANIGWLSVSKSSESNDWDIFIGKSQDAKIVRHKVIGYSKSVVVIECIYFDGFIGFHNGFINRWFDGIKPFKGGKAAWHFLGLRFRRGIIYTGCQGLNKKQLSLLKRYEVN